MFENKRTFVRDFILVMIAFICLLVVPAIGDTYQHNYTQVCEVYEVDGDVVTFIDPCGYLWDYVTTEEFNKHDTVKIYFHDAFTDSNREDDVIRKIKRVD
jgi:hypothetical protein